MITSYTVNGEQFWKVQVKVYNKSDRSIVVQRARKGIKSERAAILLERELRNEAVLEVSKRETQQKTWSLLIDDWEKFLTNGDAITAPHSITTVDDYVRPILKYTTAWMDRPAYEITIADVRKVLNEITEAGKSLIRARKIKGFITNAFRWAMDTGWDPAIKVNPALGIRMDRIPKGGREDILNLTEIKKLLSYAEGLGNEWYPVWAMAVMTGMRSGELYALLWDDIDWVNKRISVNKSYSKRAMRDPRTRDGIKCPKNGETRRVPINDELEGFLKRLKATSNGCIHVLPRIPAWRNSDQASYLKGFCKGIGIRPICFHALRACFATQLLQNQVPPVVVMAIAGWKDMKTMMRYVRMAGVDIQDGTAPLKVLSPQQVMATVHYLGDQA